MTAIKSVIKRDGSKVGFNSSKIYNAIQASLPDDDGDSQQQQQSFHIKQMTELVVDKLESKNKSEYTVLEIQKEVEDYLMTVNPDHARKYIEYRHDRDVSRETKSKLFSDINGLLDMNDEEIMNENANKASERIPTQRDLLAGIVSKHYALNHIMSREVADAHIKGELHYHDLDYAPMFPSFNCMLVALDFMLKNGFKMGTVDIETPKSITTAAAVASQIIAQVASHTYGGTSYNRFDEVMAPYAEKSYQKHLAVAYEYDINDPEQYAHNRTCKDIYDAAQSMEYECNTLHTSNGQTPFITIGFGLGTGKWEREIQKAILEIRYNGIGKNHETPVFPKLVFTLRDGINLNPEDVNYDIKQLAMKTSARRMYPDILSYDKIVDITGSFKAPMGCVDGDEVITYKEHGNVYTQPFVDFWNNHVHLGVKHNGVSEYIETSNIEILDNDGSFTSVRGIIKNPDKGDWKLVKFTNGRSLVCTGDHPLPVNGKGRTFVNDMKVGDVVNSHIPINTPHKNVGVDVDYAWLDGLIISDASFVDNIRISIGNDERDIGNKAIGIMEKRWPEQSHTYVEQNRGVKGVYLDVFTRGKGVGVICKALRNLFKASKKSERRIPDYVFNASNDVKAAFLAGVIDADGYIHPESNTVQVGSTNKVFALQQMTLAQMLGSKAKMYHNEYTKGKTRYRIEFKITDDVIKYMASGKKISKMKKPYNDHPNTECVVTEIIDLGFTGRYSYDVTTESDTFVVSGLSSHNCRSFLSPWRDSEGNEIHDGRNNLGVVSLNLPRIALESKGDVNAFWDILDDRLELAHKALKERIARFEGVQAKVAPILYCEGALGVKMNPDDYVLDLFKDGRATISLGYIGIHEMVNGVMGCDEHIFDSEDKHKFAVEVVKYLSDACAKWKSEEGWGYSLYATPSESLCNRLRILDAKEFGVVEGVTDKDYYTNSFHLDVAFKTDPYHKIKFEEDFPKYSNGGFINYVELPDMQHNILGIEGVWNYAYKHVGYFGLNMPVDQCFDCGYHGDFTCTNKGFSCPQCGNHDGSKMNVIRRVCGYLSSPNERPFNKGKQSEVMTRVKHG